MTRGRICLLGASIDDPYDSSLVVVRTSETTHFCDHGGHTGLSILLLDPYTTTADT